MVIVYTPDRPHRCGPNDRGYWHDAWNDPAGTVRECTECGKSWVAYRPHPRSGYMGVLWRREGWLARRRRRRATSPVTDAHPWQEYNAHGNTCHYPGCTLTEEEHTR